MAEVLDWQVPIGPLSPWTAALDKRIPDGLADIRERWTFLDLYEFTVLQPALDQLDDIARDEAEAQAEARAKARTDRRG